MYLRVSWKPFLTPRSHTRPLADYYITGILSIIIGVRGALFMRADGSGVLVSSCLYCARCPATFAERERSS